MATVQSASSHLFAQRRSGPAVDVIPTMKTQNERICLFLNDGRAGYLRIEDAERLQVRSHPAMHEAVGPLASL